MPPIGAARAGIYGGVDAIPASGISRYEFEQDVTDSWGSNDGTDNTSDGYTTTSQVGSYAKVFDGVNDYIPLANFGFGNGASFSIAGWVYFRSLGLSTLTARYDGTDDLINLFNSANDSLRFEIGHVSGSLASARTADNFTSTSTYYHVVGVYDQSLPETRLYVNGALEDTDTTVPDDFADAQTLTAGARSDGANYLDGFLDDIKLYNKALSDTEVSNLYNNDSILA